MAAKVIVFALAFNALIVTACATPTRQPITPILAAPSPALIATLTPTSSINKGAGAKPAWWPAEIEMPKTAEFAGGINAPAVWQTRDLNVEGIKDFFVTEATRAGYQAHILTQSKGAIYDLLFVKGSNAYALNVTKGRETTVMTGNRVGIIRLKVTGAVNVEVDLPMRERIDFSPGSELAIGTSVPSAQCARCMYYVNLHIAPFKGAGTYTDKPQGIYLIDPWIIPGGDQDKDDYRWAWNCLVIVKEDSSGSFQCAHLSNIFDAKKTIDISGVWQQPPNP